jgi:hypothetical protein
VASSQGSGGDATLSREGIKRCLCPEEGDVLRASGGTRIRAQVPASWGRGYGCPKYRLLGMGQLERR